MEVYHDQAVLKNIMTFVTREVIFYYIMAPSTPIRWGHYQTKIEDTKEFTTLYRDVYEFFSNVDPKEYLGVYNAAENIAQDLFKVLPSYISTIKEDDIVHVKVLVDPGNPIEEVISRNVQSLEFAELVPIDQYENVDVLLTTLDIYPTEKERKMYPENLKIMNWDIDSMRSSYVWLLVELNRIYVKKLKSKSLKNSKKKKA
jgi:hypothetical protein